MLKKRRSVVRFRATMACLGGSVKAGAGTGEEERWAWHRCMERTNDPICDICHEAGKQELLDKLHHSQEEVRRLTDSSRVEVRWFE